MKLSAFTLASTIVAAGHLASAQYTNQTGPFNLILLSSNTTVNGSYLSACHSGAAIESACLSKSISVSMPEPVAPSPFYFNYSDAVVTPNATLGTSGYLTYVLQGSNFNESEPMGLYYNPSSNVALPLFEPSTETATPVAFDSHGFMNIQSYVDDTTVPASTQTTIAYYRWYACVTYFEGYQYNTLSWGVGEAKPQNPSCVKVDVLREF